MSFEIQLTLSANENGDICLRWENPAPAEEGSRAINLIAQYGSVANRTLSQFANAIAEIQQNAG